MKHDNRETLIVLWINRVIRWSFGGLLLYYGIINHDESRWIVLVIGSVAFISGFIRPKRCLEENGQCRIDN